MSNTKKYRPGLVVRVPIFLLATVFLVDSTSLIVGHAVHFVGHLVGDQTIAFHSHQESSDIQEVHNHQELVDFLMTVITPEIDKKPITDWACLNLLLLTINGIISPDQTLDSRVLELSPNIFRYSAQYVGLRPSVPSPPPQFLA